MLPLFPGGVVVALHTLLIFFLVASALGWRTRFSLCGRCRSDLHDHFKSLTS